MEAAPLQLCCENWAETYVRGLGRPPGCTAQTERIVGGLIKHSLYVITDWHMLDPGDHVHNLEHAKRPSGSAPN